MSFLEFLLKDEKVTPKAGIPSLDLSYLSNGSEEVDAMITRNHKMVDETKKGLAKKQSYDAAAAQERKSLSSSGFLSLSHFKSLFAIQFN